MAGKRNNGDNKAKLNKIYDVFDKHNVPVDRNDDIWEVQGTPVVKHSAVERLGAAMQIKYEKPQILRAEADEAVILVVGSFGDKMEWSIGEAKIMQMVDTGRKNQWNKAIKEPKDGTFGNYIVSGGQAAYPWAMAEKRAKDRVILKLADLHGDAYSSEEADDFKSRNADDQDRNSSNDAKPASNDNIDPSQLLQDIKDDIDKTKTVKELTDLMNHKDMKADLKKLSKEEEDQAKAYAQDYLKNTLGWVAPPKKDAAKG